MVPPRVFVDRGPVVHYLGVGSPETMGAWRHGQYSDAVVYQHDRQHVIGVRLTWADALPFTCSIYHGVKRWLRPYMDKQGTQHLYLVAGGNSALQDVRNRIEDPSAGNGRIRLPNWDPDAFVLCVDPSMMITQTSLDSVERCIADGYLGRRLKEPVYSYELHFGQRYSDAVRRVTVERLLQDHFVEQGTGTIGIDGRSWKDPSELVAYLSNIIESVVLKVQSVYIS